MGVDLVPPVHPDDVVLDLADSDAVTALVRSERPDRVVHLAGAVFEPADAAGRRRLLGLNVGLTLVLVEALAEVGDCPRFLLAGSCAVYGVPPGADGLAREDDPVAPVLYYGFTKAAQETLASTYHRRGALDLRVGRSFNLTGPGEPAHFVTGTVARQVASGAGVVRLGNIDTVRDFIDVRDAAVAYATILDRGVPGAVYNVGRGVPVTVEDQIRAVLAAAGGSCRVERDESRIKAVDVPRIYADVARLRGLGWAPAHDLESTARDVLAAGREG